MKGMATNTTNDEVVLDRIATSLQDLASQVHCLEQSLGGVADAWKSIAMNVEGIRNGLATTSD
jgi:hypothetical protein